jgi:hypothetical protein
VRPRALLGVGEGWAHRRDGALKGGGLSRHCLVS